MLFAKTTHTNTNCIDFFNFFHNFLWTSLLCKVEFTLLQSIFFPPNFSLVFWKREIWREKIYSSKEWNLLCKGVFAISYFYHKFLKFPSILLIADNPSHNHTSSDKSNMHLTVISIGMVFSVCWTLWSFKGRVNE
jgi:hypothetical protein